MSGEPCESGPCESGSQSIFDEIVGRPSSRLSEPLTAAGHKAWPAPRAPGERGQTYEYQTEPRGGGVLGVQLSTPARAPASAMLWGVVQPAQWAGLNAAACAVDGAESSTLLAEGFLDLPTWVGLEFSAAQTPGSGVGGELQLSAPVPALPRLTLKHSVAAKQCSPQLVHGTGVSLRLGSGPGVAKLRVQQREGDAAAVLVAELASRAGGQQSILGSKLQRALGGRCGSSSTADSDDDRPCGGSNAAAPGLLPRLLRVEVARGSSGIAALTWRQDWRPRLKSCVSYNHAAARRAALEVSHRRGNAIQSGTLETTQPLADGARAFKRAGVKLALKLPAAPRRWLHVGGSYDAEAGPGYDVWLQQGKQGQPQLSRASICLRGQTRRRALSLELDYFMPL